MYLFSPTVRRVLLPMTAVLAFVVLGAAPASAHVEASSPGAQAGAGPVVVAFTVEAESPTAGITGVKTQLPAGLAPSSVSLASGPDGWVLSPTNDGYEIAGPAIATGVDAEFGITITQLPVDAAAQVPFKTLVRYSDGSEDAWIELPTADNPEPESPAPAIAVAPAAVPAPSPAQTSATPSPSATAEPSADAEVTAKPAAATDEESPSTGWVIGAIVAVAALAGAALWFRRRQSGRACTASASRTIEQNKPGAPHERSDAR